MIESIPNIMLCSYATEQFGQHGNVSQALVQEIV
jgi:hypothetical protein